MSETRFRGRPLAGSARDRRLWVEPAASLQRIVRSIELDFNTLVIAEPGGGVSTLLNQLAARFEDADREIARAWAGEADDATALLDAISDALERPQEPQRSTGPRPALARLQALAGERPGALAIVDDVPGAAGHDVFGRMRDELWEHGLQWLAGTSSDESSSLLAAPADAFFETVERLEAFEDEQIAELLARRDPAGELDDRVRARIAEHSAGNPGRALALARHALLLDPDERLEELASDPVDDVRRRLGEPAARLFLELLRGGPAGPSDPKLLARVHWSRPRAYQVFQALEREGLVKASLRRSGGAGRPRKIYEVIQT